MTPEEREQAVELLRCAADADPHGEGMNGVLGPVVASCHLWLRDERTFDPIGPVVDLATKAWYDACADLGIKWPHRVAADAYRRELLEAAQRIEEGTWP
jgi:hypothetical protein